MYSGTLSQGQLMVSYDALTRKRVNQSWEKKGFFTRRLAIRPWASLLIPFAIIFSLFWIAHQIDKPGHLVSGNRQEAGHIQHRLNRLKALNHAFVRAQAHSRSIAAKRAQEVSGLKNIICPDDLVLIPYFFLKKKVIITQIYIYIYNFVSTYESLGFIAVATG